MEDPHDANPRPGRRKIRLRRAHLRTGLIATGLLVGDPQPTLFAGGVAMLLAGAALHLYSKGCLHQNEELTRSGPYRYCRNPFYLANWMLDCGICLMIGRWWVGLPYLFVWSTVYRTTIALEEAKLEGLFGDAFRAYRERVPRLFPTRRPLPASKSGVGFSWQNPNIADGTEVPRLVGFAVAPIVLWVAAEVREESVVALLDPRSAAFAGAVAVAALWSLKVALVTRNKRGRRARSR
jgi:hypothetical protein